MFCSYVLQIRSQSCAGELCGDPVICPTAIGSESQCGVCDFDTSKFRCIQVFFEFKSAAVVAAPAALFVGAIATGAVLLLN